VLHSLARDRRAAGTLIPRVRWRRAFPCGELLNFSAGVASLGAGARCAWRNNHTLTATMGAEATLLPGALVRVLPHSIRLGDQLSYYVPPTEVPPITSPLQRLPPALCVPRRARRVLAAADASPCSAPLTAPLFM